ncbi:hypothetical protein BGX27_007386 [Mortierella sp. AM989]|nr:hypothetical protein BGX27_007386 [Mortierella sp. AM989]
MFTPRRSRDQAANASYEPADVSGSLDRKNSQKNHAVTGTSGSSRVEGQKSSSFLPDNTDMTAHQDNTQTTQKPQYIFDDIVISAEEYIKILQSGGEILTTTQLACCLSLLQPSAFSEIHKGIGPQLPFDLFNDRDRKKRLEDMVSNVIKEFAQEPDKDSHAVAEVVCLASVLKKDDFKKLFKALVNDFGQSILPTADQANGLAQLIRDVPQEYLDADCLTKILELLLKISKVIHEKSEKRYPFARAMSRVLDSMVDRQINGLTSEDLTLLLSHLKDLKGDPDPHLAYQANYAYHALEHTLDDKTILRHTVQRTGKAILGITGIISALTLLNLDEALKKLETIQGDLPYMKEVSKILVSLPSIVATMLKEGKSLQESVKSIKISRGSVWYATLRILDGYLQLGKLQEFEERARNVPCRQEPNFQRGLCQLLEELAVNTRLNVSIREGAVTFLGELHRKNEVWNSQADIKQWILCILKRLASPQTTQSVSIMAGQMRTLLQGPKSCSGTDGRDLHQSCSELDTMTTNLMSKRSTLLSRVRNNPDIETRLSDLKRTRKENQVSYIPARAKSSQTATDSFDLMNKVQKFLDLDIETNKVFLLQGDPFVGKSLFCKALEAKLWADYQKDRPIPLLVGLHAIEKPERCLVEKALLQYGFEESQHKELKEEHTFILICDGYDQIPQKINLYNANQLNQEKKWCYKMVITCRTQYDSGNRKVYFKPTVGERHKGSEELHSAVILPFHDLQIEEYIDRYVGSKTPPWEPKRYQEAFKTILNLQDLVSNPFLLKRTLEFLPMIMEEGGDFSTPTVIRVKLYRNLVTLLVEEEHKRLVEMGSISNRVSSNSGSEQPSIANLKRLSAAVYLNQNEDPEIYYSEDQKEAVFNENNENHLLRQAVPFGDLYKFAHKSVLEYGLALVIFDSSVQDLTPRRTERLTPGSKEQALLNSPLGKINLANEVSILQFLVGWVLEHPEFESHLRAIVKRSRTDDSALIAAANAYTVLVKAGVQLNGEGLRGIRIPETGLSSDVFDSALLEGADLRKGNSDRIQSAIRVNNDVVQLCDRRTNNLVCTLNGHEGVVTCFDLSPEGDMIVTGSEDMTVRVWNTDTGECIFTSKTHKGIVSAVNFSPTRRQFAAGGHEKTIRLWDVESTGKKCRSQLLGDKSGATIIKHSPDGNQLASAWGDKRIRIWEIKTRKSDKTGKSGKTGKADKKVTLLDHDSKITRIEFSSNAEKIASGSEDMVVWLWDIKTGHCVHKLQGHIGNITSFGFSLNEGHLASGSWDGTVRPWDVKTECCLVTISGLKGKIDSIAWDKYPSGEYLVVISNDDLVYHWWITKTRGKLIVSEALLRGIEG